MRPGIMRGVLIAALGLLVLSDTSATAEPEEAICGDANGDGGRNVTDIVFFDNYFWNDGPAPPDPWAANFGGCDGINVHDLQHLIDFIFCGAQPGVCDLDTACTPAYYGEISLDTVTGLLAPGSILTGCTPRFSIRLNNNTLWPVPAMTFGFRVYSPDGAEWDTTTLVATDAFPGTDAFDGRSYLRAFSSNGAGSDTVGYGGFRIGRSGLSAGYDTVSFVVEIGPIPMASVGKTICFDSCWYPPGGDWLWQHQYGGWPPSTPAWSGERCFTVEACCEHRGDVDLMGGTNVADLTCLIAHMFQGGPGPGCFEAGDIDGDQNGPNIADLTYLVAYIFQGGDPPPGC